MPPHLLSFSSTATLAPLWPPVLLTTIKNKLLSFFLFSYANFSCSFFFPFLFFLVLQPSLSSPPLLGSRQTATVAAPLCLHRFRLFLFSDSRIR
ncbi:hypothetical protein ES332_D01G186200v1 [Gossypium tomentosum]|uniref:Uncharacterized protein n=1 Tax=Gossypium tomentosum TaxID=34277 RepID=A0A5D2MAS3_GOSTO|nr:hypothetical protein ES332_D01G186200v1 [Gossypium tomentosum]